MTAINEQSRHVSFEQVKSIIEFMGQHVEFASGNLRTLEARHTSKRLWGELTKLLNGCRTGTKKNSDGWSKYWSDFKNKLKNKAWVLKRERKGSSVIKGIRPLTKLEKRALSILGPQFSKKKPRDGFSDILSDPLPPEVKLESIQEVVTMDFSKQHSETSERLSDGDDRSKSGESSSEEYVDDNDYSDPMQNLYPKWLIEVEKKRADAELIRAKAEEQRSIISVKNAEAALMQADALKRLADAANLQAEAVMRIAGILESRQRDPVVI